MVDTSYSLHENYERQEHPYDAADTFVCVECWVICNQHDGYMIPS